MLQELKIKEKDPQLSQPSPVDDVSEISTTVAREPTQTDLLLCNFLPDLF